MRTKGRITSWNDEKGYGFISALIGDDRVFVHIKDFENRSRRPVVGDIVTYSVASDAQGRPRAEAATIADVAKIQRKPKSSDFPSYLLAGGFLLVVSAAAMASAIPTGVMFVYLVASLFTFGAYAMDKSAAEQGVWRTSESTLHLLALGGGWPGALIAQNRFRHKTRKQPFRAVFWITVVLNCAALAWLFTEPGANLWNSVVSSLV